MEIRLDILLVIIGGAMVTFVPRVFPLVVLSKIHLPVWLIRWLKHIPVAIMAALLAQELIIPNQEFTYFSGNIRLLAALPTILIAVLTRSLLATVIVGVVSMMLLRVLF